MSPITRRWQRELDQAEQENQVPSQKLVDELSQIIDRNRANAGLRPLTLCRGNCGRRTEGDLCATCSYEAELGRIRGFLEKRNAGARERLAARAS